MNHEKTGEGMKDKVFICFAAEDRYEIVEPIVYHLKNYGIPVWYDRYTLLMGDNRVQKNLYDGAQTCKYAIIIVSKNTQLSKCAMEEISIVRENNKEHKVTVFPILYDISPDNLTGELIWIKKLIFKECNKNSGTYEICNHIACKITDDILSNYKYTSMISIITQLGNKIPSYTYNILHDYCEIDTNNLNSRVTILYCAYITVKDNIIDTNNNLFILVSKIFTRLFNETKLNLPIDYRELWLLENSICILINMYCLLDTI
jgi:hypothetical protein